MGSQDQLAGCHPQPGGRGVEQQLPTRVWSCRRFRLAHVDRGDQRVPWVSSPFHRLRVRSGLQLSTRNRVVQRLNIVAICTRGSRRANSRLMFSRWRNTTAPAPARPRIFTGHDSSSTNANTGTESAPVIDATET